MLWVDSTTFSYDRNYEETFSCLCLEIEDKELIPHQFTYDFMWNLTIKVCTKNIRETLMLWYFKDHSRKQCCQNSLHHFKFIMNDIILLMYVPKLNGEGWFNAETMCDDANLNNVRSLNSTIICFIEVVVITVLVSN